MTKKFIIFTLFFIFYSTIIFAENSRYSNSDKGIVSLIYHRFDETKYPSTNVQMDIFKKQINIINQSNYNYYNLIDFENFFKSPSLEKKNINYN